jgi:hypothetical protein
MMTTTKIKSSAVKSSATTDLQDLADQAAQLDQAPAPDHPGPPAPAGDGADWMSEARDCVELLRSFLVTLYPATAAVWTDQACARLTAVTAPVLQKYDLTLGRFGPEIAFAVVALPLISRTREAIASSSAAHSEQIEAPAPAPVGDRPQDSGAVAPDLAGLHNRA